MNFPLLASLLFFVATTTHGDIISDRGTNAANVASAGLDACRSNSSKNNKVPYLTSNSYMSASVSIIGGVLKYYHDKKMEKQFKDAMDGLNYRFDQLETDMNNRFDQIAGLIDRKQFESDISDPATILWEQMLSYAEHPNNMTYANKLKNRLYGPDNTLMTQIKANQYDNATFIATKDVIMYRIFQLMTVQDFCLGVENGFSYNITQDWEHQRMYSIYSDIVNNTIAMRVKQETDYLNAVAPSITSSCVTSSSTKQYRDYADCIYSRLSSQYQWDRFGVVISSHNCDHVGSKGAENGGLGSRSYSVWTSSNSNADVWIIRYWIGSASYSNSYAYDYQSCMNRYHNSDPLKWAANIDCEQSYEVLANNWFCGNDFQTYGSTSAYYVDGAQINGGTSSAVFPAYSRPTTVAYDLGFWQRPINIQLLPFPNS